uniref:Uncharacterized protein n=1 Tax=Euplotes harpa TaxID=151035 RepID=A0A7S3JDQ8_9SPIT|mmetsp:Transcript_34642/g.40094  ORF Transcript_34642/g.40094 Transcript_34642/m.40094 type:complete len:140 (+) Transcript_34642:35-454(+)
MNRCISVQKELKLTKEKPDINEKSSRLLESNRKPLHLRINEVLAKTQRDIDKLRAQITEERLKKEIEEFEQIEQNRVDRHTKGKKVKVQDWEYLYNQRFRSFLEAKNNKLQTLDQKFNKPNQGIPQINSSKNKTIEKLK